MLELRPDTGWWEVGACGVQNLLRGRGVLLVGRQAQQAAGILEPMGGYTVGIDIETLDDQDAAIVGHLCSGNWHHVQPLQHAHAVELVEAQVGRVLVRALDDVSAG